MLRSAPTIMPASLLCWRKNYADAIDRLGGETKTADDSTGKIDASKIEVMRQLIGTVPPCRCR